MIELEKHNCSECNNYTEEETLTGKYGQCTDPAFSHEMTAVDARTIIVMCPGFAPKEE